MSEHEDKAAKAARLGLVIVTPAPNELFIDLDSEDACTTFWEHGPIFASIVTAVFVSVSPSGYPWHYHVTVTLNRAVASYDERLMLQAMLGSDLLHEALCWREHAHGLDAPTVFFEKPEVVDLPQWEP